jgi:hypothetical protein
MGQNPVSPSVYWRRRMTVLAGGMAVLTLATWGVARVIGGIQASHAPSARSLSASGPAPGHQAAAGHGSATGGGHSGGGAASGALGDTHGQPARRGPGAAAGRQGLAGDTTELRTQPSPSPSPAATASATGAAPSSGSGCSHGGVVLTIHTAQYRYPAGATVTFVVGAVSTVSQPCRINLGSRFMSVVVASAGTPLWDSASCPRGIGSRVVTLRRGVSATFQVTWDRRTSISGCPGQGKLSPAGRYTAAAFEGQVRSQNTTFVLAG